MMITDIKEKCHNIIAEVAKVPVGDVNDGQKLKDDFDLDSLDAVDIVVLTENAFDIALVEGQVENLETVGDYVNLVRRTIENTFTHSVDEEEDEEGGDEVLPKEIL